MRKYFSKNYLVLLSAGLLAIFALFFVILATPQTAHALTIEPLYAVLRGNTPETHDTASQIKGIWNDLLTFVNSIAIVLLIFVAFANILRINISTYGVKKFLPALALAIIAANFSYLFCRILVDFSNIACNLFINGTASTGTTAGSTSAANVNKAFDFVKYTVNYDNYPRMLLFTILEFIGTIFILILAFLLTIRIYMIYFLVAISPLTIVCIALPMTKSVFNMWWQQFWKWTFMPVVVLFWLWLGGQWIGTAIAPDQTGSIIIGFAFAIVCYYLAITTPQKMGQGVMTSWNNLGKWGWGKTGGQAVKGGKWAASGGFQSVTQAYAQRKSKVAGLIGDKAGADRWDKIANITAYLNPQTYRKGMLDRLESAKSGREKAVLKSPAYGTVAGRVRTIENLYEVNREDDLGAPPAELAIRAKKVALGVIKSLDPRIKAFAEEQRKKAGTDSRLTATGAKHRTLDQLQREYVLNAIRTLNNQAYSDVFSSVSAKTLGENKSIANAANRTTRSRGGDDFERIFFASSAVGHEVEGGETGGTVAQSPAQKIQHATGQLEGAVGSEDGKKLADAALHGITIHTDQLHVHTPEARVQAENAINALRGEREQLVAEEKGGHKTRIDDEITGSKIVFDQVMKGGDTLSNQQIQDRIIVKGNTANNGLQALDKDDRDGALTIAKGLGISDVLRDDAEFEKKLRERFAQIQTGAKDLQSLQSRGIELPKDPKQFGVIEKQLREAKTAQASEKSEVTASARFIAEDHQFSPELIAKLGNTTVGDALGAQSEHLAGLTTHINELAKLTAEARKMPAVTFTQPQASKSFMSAITGAGVAPTATMGEAMNNPEVRKKFAQQLASFMVQAQRKNPQPRPVDGVVGRSPINETNITNVTNTTTTSTSPPIRPLATPNTTTPNNTILTPETAVPPRENPLPPPPPNKPPTTPSPIKPPEKPAP